MLKSLYSTSSRVLLMAGLVGGTLSFTEPKKAEAAGFYIQEQSVKGLGAAFSGGATSIDDASTIYFNPAGMTKLDRAQGNVGVNLLIPNGRTEDTGSTFLGGPSGGGTGGNPYDVTPVPNLYFATPVMDDTLWAGIGVSAPFGLGSDYGNEWFGRFDSTKTKLKTIDIQPSVAVQATDWLSIGGGVDIQYADADLQSAAFAGANGISKLEGDDWSFGYNVGLQLKPIQKTEIGIHYRSEVKHTLDGRISAEGTGALDFSETGSAKLNLPDIATFGIAHDTTDKLRLMGQATWFGWNNFQTIAPQRDSGTPVTPTVQNYQNTWAFAVGAEYELNDEWTVRAGYQFDETPTTDEFRTSRTPDGDRNWFSVGGTHTITPDLSLDLAATYIDIASETINVSRNGGLAAVNAKTEGNVAILALGVNYKF